MWTPTPGCRTDYYTEIIDRRAQEERDRVELEDAEEEVALEQDEVKLSAAANLVVGWLCWPINVVCSLCTKSTMHFMYAQARCTRCHIDS